MKIKHALLVLHFAILLVVAGLIAATSERAQSQPMTNTGYTIGSNLLGPTIVDNATHSGLSTADIRANDTGNGAGPYVWVAVWDDLWNIGDTVSLTGIALPVRSPNTGTANNTSNGTWTFSIYELSGGSSLTGWNGTDNGETVLATRELLFDDAGTGGAIVPYASFDTPIDFSAGSTGIAIHLDSTGSIRTRNDSAPDALDGLQFNRFSGVQTDGANDGAGHQWTLAGGITAGPAWNVDAGGQWGTAGNWTTNPEVPGVGGLSGGSVTLGSAISSAETIALDTNVNLSALNLNSSNSYSVSASGGILTLTGDAAIRPLQGTHQIDATIAGTSGLNVAGSGTVALGGANTFSGGVQVNGGTLSVASDNNLGSGANGVDLQGGALQVTGTSFTSLSRSVTVSGNAAVDVDDAANTLEVTGAVTGSSQLTKTGEGNLQLSNAASFDGDINVNEGVLRVNSANGLGTTTGQTTLAFQGGTIELDGSGGNVTLSEAFAPTGRFGVQPDIHLRSTGGSNTLTGDITAIDNDPSNSGETVRFENVADGTTLTVDSTISHSNANQFINYSFQGTGNFRIGSSPGSGKITGSNATLIVALDDPTDTVTLGTATDTPTDFWAGRTIVESGTLVVEDDNLNNGEILSASLAVQSGATLNVTSFSTYNLAVGQSLSGGGTIEATGSTLGLFDDNSISPGDSIGTLNINGNAALSNGGGGGVLSFEVGDTPATIGGSENDLIAISGTLTQNVAPQWTVDITAAESKLSSSTPYRLISHSGGTVSTINIPTPQVFNTNGNALTHRLTLSVDGSTNGQVNLVVSDSEASRTWTGSTNSVWDVNSTSNWAEGDNLFYDLDNVTFGQSGSREVTVETAVTPGSTTFNHTTGSYTVRGAGGIQGSGPVNVASGTVNLFNSGNDYSGTTTVSSGATLSMAAASTGAIVNNGTFSVGGAGSAGPNFVTTNLQLNYDAAQDTPGDDRWDDQAAAAGTVNTVFPNGAFSPNPVSDGTFQYLTAAYDMSSTGGSVAPGGQEGYFDARGLTSGTFEVVFNVSNTAAGNSQVLLEVGATRGLSLVLDGDTLKAGVNGNQTDGGGNQITTGFTSGPLAVGWHHAVVVVDNPSGDNDSFTLYVNNAVAGTTGSPLAINDYSGGNQWGIGTDNSFALDPTDGTNQSLAAPIDYHGQIAIARYYQTAFDSTDVNQNYQALQDPTQVISGATIEVDGDFTNTGTLELDVFADGTFDEILATGSALLDGTIDVSLVGTGLADGTSFTVLTALEGIALSGALNLPENFSSSIVDGTSLVLTFSLGLSGDFNGDGIVDLSDYTVWRNNLGATEDGSILNGNGNGGIVDATDYALWKTNFGSSSGAFNSLAAANVPEPSAIAILAFGSLMSFVVVRRR